MNCQTPVTDEMEDHLAALHILIDLLRQVQQRMGETTERRVCPLEVYARRKVVARPTPVSGTEAGKEEATAPKRVA